MSRLMVDTGASKYFIDNDLNSILRNLDSEMSELMSLRSRLESLNMYYSSNNNILNNLNSALNDIRYDYDALATFINNYRAFINEIEEVDSNLAAKFKKEVKEYCKSNGIETTEWYDKALDYLQVALDVVGF
ncbi:MAG: hypothetical protein IJO26_05765, partial [Clostridium sp.]|nr:hypothetical protein [Clostridium sp.]